MAKISTFIIMMIVFIMILAGGFGAFMASIATNYDVTNFNQSKIDDYNKLSELSSDVYDIENETKSLQSKSGFIDTLGGFFESGYNAIKLSYNSMSIFTSMAGQAKNDIPAFDNLGLFYIGITTIIVIIIIFIILRIVVKGDI